jgi:Ca2+-binding EF-hand superfamily protein
MMMARRGKVNVDDEIQQVFNMFDKDSTKGITKEGIQMVMNEVFGEEMSLDEAEDMVRVVDNEGKGFITYDEFREVMLNGV